MKKLVKKRRRENRTDYLKRLKLLKGKTPRLVIRKTNRYLITQYVESDQAQDKIEMGMTSKKLIEYGWPEEFKNSLKSIPASYLLGILMGKKIIREKKKTPILDFGMIRNVHKNKIFAFLKGLIDSGLKIKYKAKTFPDENKIKGVNLKKDFSDKFKEIKLKVEKS